MCMSNTYPYPLSGSRMPCTSFNDLNHMVKEDNFSLSTSHFALTKKRKNPGEELAALLVVEEEEPGGRTCSATGS